MGEQPVGDTGWFYLVERQCSNWTSLEAIINYICPTQNLLLSALCTYLCVYPQSVPYCILYHKLNTAPFNKPNTNDQITRRKLHSAFCRIWYIVVWDHFRQIEQPRIIFKHRRNVWSDLMESEAFILSCFSQWSILFSPLSVAPSQNASHD